MTAATPWLVLDHPGHLDDVHDAIETLPWVPDTYGRNLDAAFDVLAGVQGLKVTWWGVRASRAHLGADAARLDALWRDLREACPGMVTVWWL